MPYTQGCPGPGGRGCNAEKNGLGGEKRGGQNSKQSCCLAVYPMEGELCGGEMGSKSGPQVGWDGWGHPSG